MPDQDSITSMVYIGENYLSIAVSGPQEVKVKNSILFPTLCKMLFKKELATVN